MVIGQLEGSCIGLRVVRPLFGGGFGIQKKAREVPMFILDFKPFCVSFGAEKVDYFLPNVKLKENGVFVLFLPMCSLLGVVLSQIGCSFPIGN